MPARSAPPRFERARQTPVTSWDLAKAGSDQTAKFVSVDHIVQALSYALDAAIVDYENNLPPAGAFVASLNGFFDSLQEPVASNILEAVTNMDLEYRKTQRQLRGESE